MNDQKQCEPGAEGSSCAPCAVSSRTIALPKASLAWKTVARFLSQAAVGGAIGSYALLIGATVYYLDKTPNPWMVITVPFVLIIGALLGLIIGGFTLVLENLIEENLSPGPRVIVANVIGSLIAFGLAAIERTANWQLFKLTIIPGAIVGLPIGLVAGSKLRPGRILLLGADKSTRVEPLNGSRAPSVLDCISLLGGFALRIVSVTGFLMATMLFVSYERFQKPDEMMVTVFGIYYFGCTACIACFSRHRWLIAVAGTSLNILLLVLALFWDPIAVESGQPGPLMTAFFVLAFLWVLFAGTHLWGAPAKRSARLHPEGLTR
jgi:hypothetical protein